MRHWPLFDLRITTPRLSLHLPTLEQLDALADLAAEGVHDPARMPFVVPWTDAEPAERARSTVQYHWRTWGEWTADQWSCGFVTIVDGQVAGTQALSARNFSVTREVHTGSWLGLRYHGQGIGTEMRAAALHLAFAGLGAEVAVSEAFSDNPASLAVSRKLGYRPNGEKRLAIRGKLATELELRLTSTDWEEHRTVPVTIDGLEPCLALFGVEQR